MTQEKEREPEEEELEEEEEEQMEVGVVDASPLRHSAESHDLNADSVGELEPGHMSGVEEEIRTTLPFTKYTSLTSAEETTTIAMIVHVLLELKDEVHVSSCTPWDKGQGCSSNWACYCDAISYQESIVELGNRNTVPLVFMASRVKVS